MSAKPSGRPPLRLIGTIVAGVSVGVAALALIFSPAKSGATLQIEKPKILLVDQLRDKVVEHLAKFYGDQQFPQPVVALAKEGEVAVGVVTYEEEDHSELDMDSDPCKNQMKVFTDPYDKQQLPQTVTCGKKTVNKYQVVQKKKKQ